jgi:hypothetical protein
MQGQERCFSYICILGQIRCYLTCIRLGSDDVSFGIRSQGNISKVRGFFCNIVQPRLGKMLSNAGVVAE